LEAYSLFEVNQYIKRVIALNFEEPIWVECEINQISQSRNNQYLELIEKEEDTDTILARSSATIWYRQYLFIKKKLGKLANEVLQPGIKVKLKVSVEFSERYGLSFNILDIDPAYTFGQFELNRQKIIERLEKENLIVRNRANSLPLAIKKVAVISSVTAAGYKDFSDELLENPYNYTFDIDLFSSAMQGQNTEREFLLAFDSIDTKIYDCICVIRGGGAKLDLAAFDNYKMAAAIARCPVPVLTGIGHEIDQSICDIVAHTSLKTPTAVAGFIIDYNAQFEAEIEFLLKEVADTVNYAINSSKQALASIQVSLSALPKTMVERKQLELDQCEERILLYAKTLIKEKQAQILHMEERLESMHPKNVLQRGYSLVRHDGNYIQRKAQWDAKAEKIEIEFFDGKIEIKK
jgi:exodeoxyribonuclease VII large subunit